MTMQGNFYTGIGARKTPQEVLDAFSRVASFFEQDGWVLRSGGADGADSAFEAGVESSAKEIYLPWPNFNGKSGISANKHQWDAAERLASTVHPAWTYLKPPVRKLHARNTFQILGLDLATPSAFVLCWTPDGAESAARCSVVTGGTGTAIALASRHHVPVVNFANADALDRLTELVAQLRSTQDQLCQDTPVPTNPFTHLQRQRLR